MSTDQAGKTTALSGWGRFPVVEARESTFADESELRTILQEMNGGIARGLGRAYGDSALAGHVVSTRLYRRMLSFDGTSGLLHAQSGVSIADLLKVFVPRGWFPPVVPGTKYVTLGGAAAADIHGKNHHADSSFGAHIRGLRLMDGQGNIIDCSANDREDVFNSAVGGMGLAGVILDMTLQMQKVESAWITQHIELLPDLDAVIKAFERNAQTRYSVAWIDCLARGNKTGRSVLITGEHAQPDELPRAAQARPLASPPTRRLAFPFTMPAFMLNRISATLFNSLYFRLNSMKRGRSVVPYEPFFFPLDGIHNWNRAYGPQGFLQYQFVLPRGEEDALRLIIERISTSDSAPFLTVLKLFGPGRKTPLSFPLEGFTLALDFPRQPALFGLLDELDQITAQHGGRVYLCKDARLSAHNFRHMYPEHAAFAARRRVLDPNGTFNSLQSQRLGL